MKQFFVAILLSTSFLFSNAQDTTVKVRPDSTAVVITDSLQSAATDSLKSSPVATPDPSSEKNIVTKRIGSPYKTSWLGDGLIIAGAVGATLVGYQLIEKKHDITLTELATKTPDKLPFFDRGNAGYYSEQANKDSYILFDGCYGLPAIAALLDRSQSRYFGQLMAMYVETIGITGAMYTMAAGLVYRSRPFVYGDKAPLGKRTDKGAQRSFYGGHVAAVATSTFFIEKVYHDFHPNSKLQPWLYGGAVGLSALMGYWRYKAGYHFLSDCVLSFVMGSATGILIPQWHKTKMSKHLSLHASDDGRGIGFTYRFK